MEKIWNHLLGVSLTLLIATSVEARTVHVGATMQTSDTHNSQTQVPANSSSARFTFTSQNTDENHHHKHATKHQGVIRFGYSSTDSKKTRWNAQQGSAYIRTRTVDTQQVSHQNPAERKALHRARTGFHSHHRQGSRVIDLHAIKESDKRHHSIHTHKKHRCNKRFDYDITGHNYIHHYEHDPHRHHSHFTTRIIFVGGHPVYYYPHAHYYYYAGSYHHYTAPSVSTYSQSTNEPEDNRTLYELGFDWGKALLYKSASDAEFVNYLEYYIIPAPADAVEEFRSGFNIAYGADATEVFNESMADAYQQAGQSVPHQYR